MTNPGSDSRGRWGHCLALGQSLEARPCFLWELRSKSVGQSARYKETVGFTFSATHVFLKHSDQDGHLIEEHGETFSVPCPLRLRRFSCTPSLAVTCGSSVTDFQVDRGSCVTVVP